MKRCKKCEQEKPLSCYQPVSNGRNIDAPRKLRDVCTNCRHGVRTATDRQAERKRIAARKGKEYTPKAEIIQRAAAHRSRRRQERLLRIALSNPWDRWVRQDAPVEFRTAYQRARDKIKYQGRYRSKGDDERVRSTIYKHAHPNVHARHSIKRRVHLAAEQADGTLTRAVLVRLFAEAVDCPYCGLPMRKSEKTLDHVVPLSKGGVHGTCNVVIACRTCNTAKRDKMAGLDAQDFQGTGNDSLTAGSRRPRPRAIY